MGKSRADRDVVETDRALEQGGIAGDHDAAFARGNGLGLLQAVGADIAQGAQRAAFIGCAHALAAVFDDLHAMPAGHCQDGVEIGRIPLQVHRHDGLGGGRDAVLDIGGVEIEAVVDLGEDGQGARLDDGAVVGIPGPRGQDHFIARTDFERGQGTVRARRFRWLPPAPTSSACARPTRFRRRRPWTYREAG